MDLWERMELQVLKDQLGQRDRLAILEILGGLAIGVIQERLGLPGLLVEMDQLEREEIPVILDQSERLGRLERLDMVLLDILAQLDQLGQLDRLD